MEVRQLAADDWDLLRTVRLAALADAPHAFRTTLADAAARPDEVWQRQAAGHLGGRPCGTWVAVGAGGSAGGMVTALDADDSVQLIQMWVAPEQRGTGLADRLLEAVVAWSPGRTLELDVAAGNDRARRLYERHGFVVGGRPEAGCEIHMVRP